MTLSTVLTVILFAQFFQGSRRVLLHAGNVCIGGVLQLLGLVDESHYLHIIVIDLKIFQDGPANGSSH